MYTLVPTACEQSSKALLHGSTAAFLVIALRALVGSRSAARFAIGR
jgi:hypothetical protein